MAELGTSLLSGLSSINSISGASQNRTAVNQTSETNFASVLSDAMEQYEQVENQGDYATLDLLTGNTDNLSGTMIATEKAEIALNLTVAIRNKAVDAYKEIMNMQI